MTAVPTYVVVPTRDRQRMVANAVSSVIYDVEAVFLIDNLSNPPIVSANRVVEVIPYRVDPPNISEMWNIGIDLAELRADQRNHKWWNVLVINSDIIAPKRFVSTLSAAMRATRAACAYPDQHGDLNRPELYAGDPGPNYLHERICGFAFMLRGEAKIRLDENLEWWYGDDDLDWRCRQAGGCLRVPGVAVQHLEPNGSTNADVRLQRQAGIDRVNFAKKWGRTPW